MFSDYSSNAKTGQGICAAAITSNPVVYVQYNADESYETNNCRGAVQGATFLVSGKHISGFCFEVVGLD